MFILVLRFKGVVAATTTATTTTTIVTVAVATTVATTMYHPQFLSRTEFDQMSTAATLATTAATVAEPTTIAAAPIFDRPQIVQWRSLWSSRTKTLPCSTNRTTADNPCMDYRHY